MPNPPFFHRHMALSLYLEYMIYLYVISKELLFNLPPQFGQNSLVLMVITAELACV